MHKIYFPLWIFISIFYTMNLIHVHGKDVPPLLGPVIMDTKVTKETFANELSQVLAQVHQHTGIQIQIYIFDSLEDESIESYSMKVADEWKIGGQKEDKGLILLIALKNRKIRIEVGQGLEGEMTDLYSKRIVDGMKPFLKAGNFESALLYFLEKTFEKLQINPQEYTKNYSTLKQKNRKFSSTQLVNLLLIFFAIIIMYFRGPSRSLYGMGRRNRSYDIFLGGGGGRGSGGGGWSGGGGGFSGGGASGDW